MKFFTKSQLLHAEEVPFEASLIGANVMRILASCAHPGSPDLLHVGIHDGEDDCSLYEVLLKLAPGLEIATKYGLPEDLEPDMTDEELDAVEVEAQDNVVNWVEETIQACIPRLDRLADIVHEARLEARRLLAEWNRRGEQVRLVDVRLAPFDHWRGEDEPALVILLEAVGARLTPEIIEVQLETPDKMDAELLDLRMAIAARCLRGAEMMAKGANGTISRLALNAIDSYGDRYATIRRFAAEWRFWLPDDTALMVENGNVDAYSGCANDPIEWHPNRIRVDANLVDEKRLKSAIGRPVTELLDHEFLSGDMIVTGVSSERDEERTRMNIWLDMPRLLFCSISGRTWSDESTPAVSAVSDLADDGNVVAFRKRTG